MSHIPDYSKMSDSEIDAELLSMSVSGLPDLELTRVERIVTGSKIRNLRFYARPDTGHVLGCVTEQEFPHPIQGRRYRAEVAQGETRWFTTQKEALTYLVSDRDADVNLGGPDSQ